MDPALGLNTTSTWVLKGVPSRFDKQDVISIFANPRTGWTGWIVKPKRIISARGSTAATWIVDAAQEPPLRTVMVNQKLILIEKYIEKRLTSRMAPWFNMKLERSDNVEGAIYEEEQNIGLRPLDVDKTPQAESGQHQQYSESHTQQKLNMHLQHQTACSQQSGDEHNPKQSTQILPTCQIPQQQNDESKAIEVDAEHEKNANESFRTKNETAGKRN